MKEREIRPKNLHDTILNLAKTDTENLVLPLKDKLVKVPCPACASQKYTKKFVKTGLDYVLCDDCHTLYLSPRLPEKLMEELYSKMESVKYWETNFYKQTAEVRREKMYAPRAKQVIDVAKKYNADKSCIMDVGCGYGVFLDEVRKKNHFDKVVGIEPVSQLAEVSRQKDIEVIEKWITADTVGQIDKKASVLTCFEVLEHVYNPADFLQIFSNLLLPNGLFILSFPSTSGFDAQIMQDKSNVVYPPHHINAMSVEGIKKLVDRVAEFELVEISTPGKLDVDIVKTALSEGKISSAGPFFDYLFWRNDQKALNDLQTYLQKNLLSSHIFLVLKKK